MYQGYMALGGATLQEQTFELINTMRVQRYVENWNRKVRQNGEDDCLSFMENCDDCDSAEFLFTDGEGYFLPEIDPAPWYDPTIRDSDKFFGVMGLEVQGAEDSTRTASVEASVEGGGAISRLRFGPREIIVRGLAVAADSCGMEVGLNWMRCQYEIEIEECGKDYLWFLDCCPICATDPNAPPVGPCWPDTYEELATGPLDCPPATCWIANYNEFVIGPNAGGYESCGWCAWIGTYSQVLDGLPQFACDVSECLVPYLRQFQSVRVTEGPIILNRQTMPSGGEIAEVEFTVACGDPHEYTVEVAVAGVQPIGPTVQVSDPPPDVPVVNPFFPPSASSIPRGPSTGLVLPTVWERSTIPFVPERRTSLSETVPGIMLAAVDTQVGPVRVGVWKGGELVSGYVLPFIPATGLVKVDSKARRITTEYDGESRTLNGFARRWDGDGFAPWAELETGEAYTVTVDQPVGESVELLVELLAAEKGCA